MVKDPTRRKLNRKIDRQKKARMRQNEKLLSEPTNSEAEKLVEFHGRKVTELKRMKQGTAIQEHKTESGSS